MQNIGFVFPDEFSLTNLVAELDENYEFLHEPCLSSEYVLYDSFDWRLFQLGYALYRHGERLVLRRLEDGTELSSTQIAQDPGYVWDLPASPLRERLTPILEMRRLLEQAHGETKSITLRVLNTNQKTVARLVYEEWFAAPQESPNEILRVVWVQPVRGYPRYSQKLIDYFEKTGFAPIQPSEGYFASLAAAGVEPGDYSAKLDQVKLSPDMRSDDAAKIILRFTLGVIKKNEPGILADLDTEFLHDYRVAVRRTRSALTQIQGVFSPREVAYFKGEFSKLGQLTNALRDLDVYLLNENTYKAMLPQSLREGISPLFEYLRGQREAALKTVRVGLKSENYRALLAEWQSFLEQSDRQDEDPQAPNAGRPVMELACERIAKRYQRVLRDGEDILQDAQVEDDKLHALRIDCKKLRYLLEFFASLFPTDEIDELVRQLKTLQDNLGDFNDLCIQGEYLLNISQELPLDEDLSRTTLASIGGLVGVLEREKVRVRGDFAETFRQFASKKNQKLFRAMISRGSTP